MTIYMEYFVPLCVVVMLSTTGTRPMLRTALAIAANWLANTLYVYATVDYTPWAWFIATDAVAAWTVLWQPAGRVQSLIGWCFMAQILFHGVYAISDPVLAAHSYWIVLTLIAFLQLAFLGGWIVGHWGKAAYRAWGRRRADLARTSSA